VNAVPGRMSYETSDLNNERAESSETLSEIVALDVECPTESLKTEGLKWYQITGLLFFLTALICVLTLALCQYTAKDDYLLYNDLLASSIAGIGAVGRWFLSGLNNSELPWGTYSANVIGTSLTVIVYELSILYPPSGMFNWSTFISGGALGSLSTMSTYCNEISNLPPLKSVLYIGLTHMTTLVLATLVVVIIRSV